VLLGELRCRLAVDTAPEVESVLPAVAVAARASAAVRVGLAVVGLGAADPILLLAAANEASVAALTEPAAVLAELRSRARCSDRSCRASALAGSATAVVHR